MLDNGASRHSTKLRLNGWIVAAADMESRELSARQLPLSPASTANTLFSGIAHTHGCSGRFGRT